MQLFSSSAPLSSMCPKKSDDLISKADPWVAVEIFDIESSGWDYEGSIVVVEFADDMKSLGTYRRFSNISPQIQFIYFVSRSLQKFSCKYDKVGAWYQRNRWWFQVSWCSNKISVKWRLMYFLGRGTEKFIPRSTISDSVCAEVSHLTWEEIALGDEREKRSKVR